MFGVNNNATFKETFSILKNDLSLLYSILPGDSIAVRIYKLRKLHGLSFKEFGERVGVGDSTGYKWENEITDPNEESLDKIIKAFGLRVNYFETEKD